MLRSINHKVHEKVPL